MLVEARRLLLLLLLLVPLLLEATRELGGARARRLQEGQQEQPTQRCERGNLPSFPKLERRECGARPRRTG